MHKAYAIVWRYLPERGLSSAIDGTVSATEIADTRAKQTGIGEDRTSRPEFPNSLSLFQKTIRTSSNLRNPQSAGTSRRIMDCQFTCS